MQLCFTMTKCHSGVTGAPKQHSPVPAASAAAHAASSLITAQYRIRRQHGRHTTSRSVQLWWRVLPMSLQQQSGWLLECCGAGAGEVGCHRRAGNLVGSRTEPYAACMYVVGVLLGSFLPDTLCNASLLSTLKASMPACHCSRCTQHHHGHQCGVPQ